MERLWRSFANQRAGLASRAAVSLESLNFPGRYVRHSLGLLYVHELSTTSDRVDATFAFE